MSERFEKLHKIPAQPAKRFLAMANAKLKTELTAPANASVSAVLAELEAADAKIDMLRLLSVALPPRETVWWACLAARDIIADQKEKPLTLKAAEAWVFGPTPENRNMVQTALEAADPDDPTVLAATAALYAPGNLSDDEDMKDTPAPVGIVSNCAFGMNLKSLKVDKEPQARLDFLIDRAIDIARGGHGQIKRPSDDSKAETETETGAIAASPEQGSA